MIRISRLLLCFLVLGLILSSLNWAEVSQDTFQELLRKADEAVEYWEIQNADFYIARYLGLAANNPALNKGRKDLQGVILKRKLYPKAFLPGDFDPEFLHWFETGLDSRWGPPEERVREKYRAVEIESAVTDDNYFASVVMVPELESWFSVKENEAPVPMTLVLGSTTEKTTVLAGRSFVSAPSIYFNSLAIRNQRHAIHYFWKPEFHDLDGDQVPELWLRYNLAWGNGFVQVLGIYKIVESQTPVLIKEFRGLNEGIARRVGDRRVQVALGHGSHSRIPHTNFDRHRVQIWEFQKGKFKKISEESIPHILKTPEWKKYYFDLGEG